VEQQSPQVSALAPISPTTAPPVSPAPPEGPITGSWPTVPPAPAPKPPPPTPDAPEPPSLVMNAPTAPIRISAVSLPAPRATDDDEPPTMAIPPVSERTQPIATRAEQPGSGTGATVTEEPGSRAGTGADIAWTEERRERSDQSEEGRRRPVGAGTRASGASASGSASATSSESPLLQLQRTVRRQQALTRTPGRDLVWQPRFAYTSALVILFALTVVSMPLWIVLYRITDTATGGAPVADLVALCMMLLGGFLTGAAAWVIIIEMRGRVRMVDTLARSGEREALIAPATPELPVLDAPVDGAMDPMARPREAAWDPDAAAAAHQARVEAQQVNAASMLEASSKLLTAFSTVLRSFGQLPAQVAMLAVALALFVGATMLSLH